jgi:hypothetical protein
MPSFYFLWKMEPGPNDIKAIRILFYAFLAGQLLFTGIVIVINNMRDIPTHTAYISVMQIFAIGFAVVLIPTSFFFFRKQLSQINPEDDLRAKLDKYRATLIIRMGMCQMPVMFAIIAYFITANRPILWLAIALIVNFFLINPTDKRLVDQLQLNSKEQAVLGFA